MRIALTHPIVVSTESGDVTCTESEVSVAVSNSVAMSVVPVGPDGTIYSGSTIGIVGTSEQEDFAVFLASVSSASSVLMATRGI